MPREDHVWDQNQPWESREYTAKEWPKGSKRPPKKSAQRDKAKDDKAYRSNYEATFGHE